MSRIRTIKPEFWTSEQIVECSTTARLLFIGTWNFADDNGVLPASCRQLKMQIFPGDDISSADINLLVQELIRESLLVEFEGNDKRKYWHITGWFRHQRIDRPNARFPVPPGFSTKFADSSTSIRRTFDEQSPPEGKGREGKGKEGNGRECNVMEGREKGTRARMKKTFASPALGKDKLIREKKASRFSEFWETYPSPKTRETEAFDTWQEQGLDSMADLIIQDVQHRRRDDVQWLDGFVPGPLGYLKGRRWQDEITTQHRVKKNAKHTGIDTIPLD